MNAKLMANPFIGMRPYEEKDRAVFFGRNEDCHYLLSSIDISGISLLYAKTGVGKSSLLNAGVIPLLKANSNVLVISISNWRDGLKDTLSRSINKKPYASLQTLIDNIKNTSSSNGNKSVIFIFDQFEELLIGKSSLEIEETASAISAIVNTNCPAGVILSMREEFLAELSPFSVRIPSLYENQYRLLGFTVEKGTEVIQKIAETSTNVKWSSKLSEEIVSSVIQYSARHDSNEYLHLGVAQIVAFELFQNALIKKVRSASPQTLVQMKGVDGIIDSFCSRRLSSLLESADQIVFAGISKYLSTRSGVKISVTIDDIADFFSFDEIPLEQKQIIAKEWGLSNIRKGVSRGENRNRIASILDTLSDDGFFLHRLKNPNSQGDVYAIQHDVAMLLLSRWRANLFHNLQSSSWLEFSYNTVRNGKLEYYYYSVSDDLPGSVLAIIENLRDRVLSVVSSAKAIKLEKKIPITISQLLEDIMAYKHPILDLAYRDLDRTKDGAFYPVGTIDTCVLVFHRNIGDCICSELSQDEYFTETEPNWFNEHAKFVSISEVFEMSDRHTPVALGIYCQTSTTIENALYNIADDWIKEGKSFQRVTDGYSDTPFGSDRDLRAILNNIVYSNSISLNDASQMQYIALVDWPLFEKVKDLDQYKSNLAFLPVKYNYELEAGYFLPPDDTEFANIVTSCIEEAIKPDGEWDADFVRLARKNLVRISH